MRIAYLSCDFGISLFETKGASVHLQEMAHALRRLGHVVKVFSPNPSPGIGDPQEDDFHVMPLGGFAGEVVRLLAQDETAPPGHLVREWRSLLYCEYAQKTLLPALIVFQPDLIYERYSLFGYPGVELARQLGVPLLLEVNAPLWVEQVKYRQLVLKRTAEVLERMILNAVDALIVVSTALAHYARWLGVPSERIIVSPNGVNPEQFHPAVSGAEVRSLFGLDGKWVVGFVGGLRPWHDLDTLLAAIQLLANTEVGVHLLIVGEGPQIEQLRGLGENYITCTGAVEHQQLPQFMAAMDVVVVPYPKGGDTYFSPLKLFEAMAMAKPIVGARLGQVAEVLIHGETGLLYEPGNAEDMANKIREVLAMSDHGGGLGAAARQWVLAGHTWEHNARQIVAIGRSLIRKRAGHYSEDDHTT